MNESVKHDMSVNIEMLSPEEGRALLEERAQMLLGISGAEFVQRYHAGDLDNVYNDPAHHVAVHRLVMLLPFWCE